MKVFRKLEENKIAIVGFLLPGIMFFISAFKNIEILMFISVLLLANNWFLVFWTDLRTRNRIAKKLGKWPWELDD